MQKPDEEVERQGRKQRQLRWAFRRQGKDENGMTAESSVLSRSSKCHFSYQTRLGQDVLQLENKDQYAGHRTEERRERKWERQAPVFTAAISHFLCLTTTLMTPFPLNLLTP